MDQSNKVPVIGIDLDGVLWKDSHLIPGVGQTINQLTTHHSNIPLLFITNSGAQLESQKLSYIIQKLQLSSHNLTNHNIILNYTPLRQEIADQFTHKVVLIAGHLEYEKVALDCGLHQYITFDEYSKIYPHLVPYVHYTQQQKDQAKQAVK